MPEIAKRILRYASPLIIGLPAVCHAQDAHPASQVRSDQKDGIQDIVVTATRSATRVQETPLAITAIGGEALAERQINSVVGLAQNVPSMQIGSSVGQVRVAIRGVGLDSTASGAEGRVAYHIDGVYISRPRAIGGTFFDIDRIEVLRGPQGTLYGRNATGGAVNLITKKPQFELGGYLRLGVGNYQTIRTEGAINIPFSDTVAVRLAEQATDQNRGYGRNTFLNQDITDQHARNFRGQVTVQPSSDLTINLSADYAKQRDHNFQDTFGGAANPALVPTGLRLGGSVASNPRDINGDALSLNRQKHWGLAITVSWNLGGAQLNSISAYRHDDIFFQRDQDITEVPAGILVSKERSHQLSQELRLNGDFAWGKWLIGGYAFRERNFGTNAITPFLTGAGPGATNLINGAFNGGQLDTDAYAGFSQVNLNVTRTLTLIAGARYSHEKKSVDEFVQAAATAPFTPGVPLALLRAINSDSWGQFTPHLSVEFKPDDNRLVYATYSKGFKSGGYGTGSLLPAFDPETLTNYEVGLKADWLDRTLRTNFSLFYYDYKNLQLQQSSPTATGVIVVLNAKGATIKGAEAELTYAPLPGLELGLVGSVLDTEFDTLFIDNPRTSAVDPTDLQGRKLTQAPDYMINASAEYTTETNVGTFSIRAELLRSGRTYFSPYNFKDILSQAPFSKVNAFLNFEDKSGKWTASIWGRNLTNKRTQASSATSGALFGAPFVILWDPPRTFGLDVVLRF